MIRYPNITGATDAQKLEQMKSYLYQIVSELNYQLEMGSSTSGSYASTATEAAKTQKKTDPISTFNDIKALIIKSADIVNSYYEQISKKLEGIYVSVSDFGAYEELTSQEILANSTAIDQFYKDLQQIITNIEDVEHTLIEVNAHIKSGLLYYDEQGSAVYGLEIGQRTEINGEEVFNKYARFTSDKLSFYDNNGIEVAYISDKKLYINYIEVTGGFAQGGFVDTALPDGSVVTKWRW